MQYKDNYSEFIVSKCNKKSVKKCKEVALSQQRKGSLVFVSGPSPSGKTCLLQKISEVYQDKYGSIPIKQPIRVITNDYINSIKNKKEDVFLHKYSSEQLLLVDDVQEVLGFLATQEALADIFTILVNQGVNVILFSEYKLNNFTNLYVKLKNRHINLIKVNIQKADCKLRKKALNNILNKEGLKLTNKVFYYIVINKNIEVSSFKGCVGKIELMKNLESKDLSNKQILKILKEYERRGDRI